MCELFVSVTFASRAFRYSPAKIDETEETMTGSGLMLAAKEEDTGSGPSIGEVRNVPSLSIFLCADLLFIFLRQHL